MKVLENIGIGLFLFSIVSMVLWSPRPFSIPQGLDDVLHKVSKKEQFFVEKIKTIPFKIDSTIKDTIRRMKIDIQDSKDSYSNSLTRTNEENVKPTLNEISNWAGVDQNPSISQENLNKPKEKACEVKVASKEIENGDLNASYITSNDLKDTTYGQKIELYKQTITTSDQSNDRIANHAHEVFDKSNLLATSAIEKANDWVADCAHEVFDRSGSVAVVAENEVGKIMDTTFQEMDMKKTLKFTNNGIPNIVESSEENVFQEDLNEENAHKNPQDLGEQWDQMSKDRGLNSIEQSSKGVDNLWLTFADDAKINEEKNNEFHSPQELHKPHREISAQQNNHFQGDYDDVTNYEGVKERIVKYSRGTYRDPTEVGANDDSKASKYIQRVRNHAHHRYRDARQKASEFYNPMEDAPTNFRKNDQYYEYDGYDDDEDFYEEL